MGFTFTAKNINNFAVYSASKLIVLLVPILLSFQLAQEDYVSFEVFLSKAQIIAPLILLGVHSSYGYYCISMGKEEYSTVITFYLSLALLLVCILGFTRVIENYLIFLVSVQIFFTSFFQVRGEIQRSYIVASIVYLAILCVEFFSFKSDLVFLLFSLLLVFYMYITFRKDFNNVNYEALNKVLKFGFISTILGLIISSLTLGGRAILETVSTQSEIFTYSLNWRYLSILPLVAFQFISSLLNHKLYRSDIDYVDKYVLRILPFVILSIILANLICFYLLEHLYDNYQNNLQLSLFVSYQIYFWILIVISEVIVNRFDIDRMKVIFSASAIIALAMLVFYIGDFSNYISLLFLINATLFSLIFAIVMINKIKIILYLAIPPLLSNFVLYILHN